MNSTYQVTFGVIVEVKARSKEAAEGRAVYCVQHDDINKYIDLDPIITVRLEDEPPPSAV